MLDHPACQNFTGLQSRCLASLQRSFGLLPVSCPIFELPCIQVHHQDAALLRTDGIVQQFQRPAESPFKVQGR